ncbi:hypothetical protein ACVFYP_22365 [Roseomonas sp. F4]
MPDAADLVASPPPTRHTAVVAAEEAEMRQWMALLAGLVLAGDAAAQRPPPPAPSTYWPPAGRIGIAAAMGERTAHHCVLSLVLLNNSGQDFRYVTAEMEVFTRRTHGEVTDVAFRLADNGRPRVADAFVGTPCPTRPRIVIRSLTCTGADHIRVDCWDMLQAVTPPNRNTPPLPLTIHGRAEDAPNG